MSAPTEEPKLEGKITVRVTNRGHDYCMTGTTFVEQSGGVMLISDFALPQKMNEYVLERAVLTAQAKLADKIANDIEKDVERLYRKEVTRLAGEWARKDKDKIVKKLLQDAKADFMAKFDDYEDY